MISLKFGGLRKQATPQKSKDFRDYFLLTLWLWRVLVYDSVDLRRGDVSLLKFEELRFTVFFRPISGLEYSKTQIGILQYPDGAIGV